MIKYFLQYSDNNDIGQIITLINNKKQRLQNNDFSEPYFEAEQSKTLFRNIKESAIKNNSEQMANAQYVVSLYLDFFCAVSSYFNTLKNKQYKSSWNILQDCFDIAVSIGRFVSIDSRYEIPQMVELLKQYENLYPYQTFTSSEYVIKKSHCSICGLPMQSFDCLHIRNELYWGDMAVEIVDDILPLQAICLVSNPLDKRCIVELADDKRTDIEVFKKIDKFISFNLPFLQMFSVTIKKEYRQNKNIKKVGRNDLCACGSNKKYKTCCWQNLHYEHLRYIVTKKDYIELIMM